MGLVSWKSKTLDKKIGIEIQKIILSTNLYGARFEVFILKAYGGLKITERMGFRFTFGTFLLIFRVKTRKYKVQNYVPMKIVQSMIAEINNVKLEYLLIESQYFRNVGVSRANVAFLETLVNYQIILTVKRWLK